MSDNHTHEPPLTFQHVIGEQTIEIIMLRKELQQLQQTIQEQQQIIEELRSVVPEVKEEEPTPIKKVMAK